MIIEKILERKQSLIRQLPVLSNRASEMGHPCERHLVLNRTRWQEKQLTPLALQLIFEEGRLHEKQVLRDIEDAGFTVIEQQRDYAWANFNLTGHIDAKILLPHQDSMPIEVKSCSPFVFEKVNSLADLLQASGRLWYLQKYPVQLTLYLLLGNAPHGLLIFKNKVTGALKEIEISLDMEFAEGLLKKAERINAHVAADTLPDRIPYDEAICGSCAFLHICLPEVKREALDILTDPELEAKLARRADLAPLADEYEALDKDLKKRFKEHDRLLVGEWLISGKFIERKAYEVKASRYWQTKIDKLQPTEIKEPV